MLALVAASSVRAEEPEHLVHPLKPAQTSSPRDTLESFITHVNRAYELIRGQEEGRTRGSLEFEHHVQGILQCLDMSEIPEFALEFRSGEAAVCLKETLDRIELPPYGDIPDVEQLEADGLTTWRIPHTPIRIHRIAEGPRAGEWLFAPDTIGRACDNYRRVASLPYRAASHPGQEISQDLRDWYLSEPKSAWVAAVVHWLPDWMQARVGGQAVWQWIGLVMIVVLALAVMMIAYVAGRRLGAQAHGAGWVRYTVSLVFPVAAMVIPLLARDVITDQLSLTGTMLMACRFVANLLFLFAAMIVIVAAGNRLAAIIISSPRIHPRGIDAQLVRLGLRVTSITGAVIVFMEGGRHLGIPVSTLVAGAGVGGLALALAAQDALKNLFGSMMIILDRPYRVGERIVAKGYDGVVEEIGLRSTKIRLLTGHLVTIPNEEMARADVENVQRRPHVRHVTNIPIPLDVPRDKAERAVEIVRELLEDHEGMQEDLPPRVFLNEYHRDALNLRIIYWYHPPDYWACQAFNEKLNLEIKTRFEAEGIPFALPTTKTYMVGTEPKQ